MPNVVHTSARTHTLSAPSIDGSLISLLPNDVLWHIFSLNADMDRDIERPLGKIQDRALNTLRYTSQVCANWRELSIGLSTLWARVLNLNALSKSGDKWRKEVIHRTGTSLLHIKSGAPDGYRATQKVEYILTEQWTRIRSLALDLSGAWYDRADVHRWRNLFQRPAPSLEVFKLLLPGLHLHAPDFVLFSNQAPSLWAFYMPDMLLDLTTFSLPNLRDLSLPSESLSSFDLLTALSHMPLLETLKANSERPFIQSGNTKKSLPLVALPHLIDITFSGFKGVNIHIALSFLAQITPAKGCALKFRADYGSESPDTDNDDLCGRILSKYYRHYTELATSNNLHVGIAQGGVFFGMEVSFHIRFSFEIGIEQIGLPGRTLLSSFSVLRLDSIKKLNLYLDHQGTTPSNTDVANFILALVSVEELESNALTFVSLQSIQSNTKLIVFPTLKIITLNHYFKQPQQDQLPRVAEFINARTNLGGLTDILTVQTWPGFRVDIKPLADLVPGLTVRIL